MAIIVSKYTPFHSCFSSIQKTLPHLSTTKPSTFLNYLSFKKALTKKVFQTFSSKVSSKAIRLASFAVSSTLSTSNILTKINSPNGLAFTTLRTVKLNRILFPAFECRKTQAQIWPDCNYFFP
uniref:Uncharacterized protein n=1 Tax=Panagrolaimus sp. ES5 TaxID=591445 RepID=A0AC34GXL8_9BILA